VLRDAGAGEEQQVVVTKGASTPHDQSEGVVRASSRSARWRASSPARSTVFHGTTVATNMVIERTGAEVGMITTRGFRDILHMARHKRPHNFSLQFDVPWQSKPLVKRRNRLPVTERIMPPTGEIEVPLDEDEVKARGRTLRQARRGRGDRCFLFSFLNNEHEQRAKEIVKSILPDAFVFCSSDVVNTIREYERFSSAAMNAYIGPRLRPICAASRAGCARQRHQGHGPHHAVERRHLDDREFERARSACCFRARPAA
jgi:N-methylhydantoinase A